jgi:hypothetical protein
MFETLETASKPGPPRWLTVSGAVIGAFTLGLATGKFL